MNKASSTVAAHVICEHSFLFIHLCYDVFGRSPCSRSVMAKLI